MIVEDWPEVKFVKSSHVHDFRTHVFKDGTEVSVDGGYDYIKRAYPSEKSGYGTKWIEYNLDDAEPFNVIKGKLLWGTRGKDGKQPLKYVRFIDCESEHLQSILDYTGYGKGKELSKIQKDVIKSILYDRNRGCIPETIIHKSIRPVWIHRKTRCGVPLTKENSRTRWYNVTCRECLSKRNIDSDFE